MLCIDVNDPCYNIMLKQLPRIPLFPQHLINKTIRSLEHDVQEDVIPVSAGIYSEMKLIERLQAIPKPHIVNYQDTIFYELIDTNRYPCKSTYCPSCSEQYNSKKCLAIQCYFCGIWNCSNCICSRKRYHPQATQVNSQRFTICTKCDGDFLSLSLNHDYFQKKCLYEQLIRRIRKEKDHLQLQCQKKEIDSNYNRQALTKNTFKISSLKKEQADLKKSIIKMQNDRENQTFKMQVKEKYLGALVKKRQIMRQMAQNSKRKASQQEKPYKQQSGQHDRVDRSASLIFRKAVELRIQNNQASQEITNQHQIEALQPIQEQHIHREQQNTHAYPAKQQQQESTQRNFFNYNQWGSQKVSILQGHMKKNLKDLQATQSQSNSINIVEQRRQESGLKKKMAQIFSKPQVKYESDQEQDLQSLDDQVIKIKKNQVMKAAFKASQKKMQSLDWGQQMQMKKCSCNIY